MNTQHQGRLVQKNYGKKPEFEKKIQVTKISMGKNEKYYESHYEI
jgi:hypothetical protein